MRKLQKISLTVNNDETHPLVVTCDVNCAFDANEGWYWEVDQIHSVELVIGDKVGIDITRQVLADVQARAIIEAVTADCEGQIYEALKQKEAA